MKSTITVKGNIKEKVPGKKQGTQSFRQLQKLGSKFILGLKEDTTSEFRFWPEGKLQIETLEYTLNRLGKRKGKGGRATRAERGMSQWSN